MNIRITVNKLFIFSLVSTVLSAFSFSVYASNYPQQNVIFVMLDGVRWQEFYHGSDPDLDRGKREPVIFKNLFESIAQDGRGTILLGDRLAFKEMTVSNSTYISLPAYESIMAGYPQFCLTNNCGRIGVETFPERLVRELHLDKYQVATIASWPQIADAAEHVPGTTFVNAGNLPLNDIIKDKELFDLNANQIQDPGPWGSTRMDKHTFAHAMRYLRVHQPRFMFISLNDSDEWGHHGEYQKYISALHQYDTWIAELRETLSQMGDYGRSTSIIITTDHGRGNKSAWSNHGFIWPETRYVWLYGYNPNLFHSKQVPTAAYAHVDIRPTIEALMGLTPQTCKGCGRPIEELLR